MTKEKIKYKRKPEWLRAKLFSVDEGMEVEKILKRLDLNTVCREAKCPNIGECFNRKSATFMILGKVCTRNCKFCNVKKGKPEEVNPYEPENIAKATMELGLKHVVVTSVTRDDLEDGGSKQFSKVIRCIRNLDKCISIEVLIPDFKGELKPLLEVIEAGPHIINHNLETVPRLYSKVRPIAEYNRSLELLRDVKKYSDDIISKSGIMVGLGETEQEVIQVMKDLRAVDCDSLTIGQYLAPSREHYPVFEYIRPEVFEKYEMIALDMNFKSVAAGPLVRSSYNAGEYYKKII